MNDLLNFALALPVIFLVLYNFRVAREKNSVPPFTERIDTFEAEESLELFHEQMNFIYQGV